MLGTFQRPSVINLWSHQFGSSLDSWLTFYPLLRRDYIFHHVVFSFHGVLYKLYSIFPQVLVLDLLSQSFQIVKIYFLSLLNLMVMAFKILYFCIFDKGVTELKRFATWVFYSRMRLGLDSFIYLQQLKRTEDSHSKLCLSEGRLSHCLCVPFG